jgi:hypothetical protein
MGRHRWQTGGANNLGELELEQAAGVPLAKVDFGPMLAVAAATGGG